MLRACYARLASAGWNLGPPPAPKGASRCLPPRRPGADLQGGILAGGPAFVDASAAVAALLTWLRSNVEVPYQRSMW
jgi:hypothetical protein